MAVNQLEQASIAYLDWYIMDAVSLVLVMNEQSLDSSC